MGIQRKKTYSKAQKQQIKEEIINKLSIGQSLRKILRENKKLPCRATVYTWLNSEHEEFDKSFLNQYVRAREDSADIDAEKMEQMVEDVETGKLSPDKARVMMDMIKWTAGKKKPKKYGDKIDMTSGGETIENVVLYLPDNGRQISKPDSE